MCKLISQLWNDEHGREYLDAWNKILELDPYATHLVVIAELVNASLPQELISRLLFLYQNGKVLVQLSSVMIINEGLDGLTDSFLKAGVFEEDELLR